MPLEKEQVFLSEEDYLREEHHSEFKNEYIDGQIYAMVGASANHNHLSSNMLAPIKNHLKNSTCNVLQSDFKVKIGTKFFYPDVLVRCDKDDDYYTEKPTLIIEVLSPATAKYDRSFKLATYIRIPSLVEYVMIEQSKCLVEVYQRQRMDEEWDYTAYGLGDREWNYTAYGLGDDIHFRSINLTLSVKDIYESVDNLETED